MHPQIWLSSGASAQSTRMVTCRACASPAAARTKRAGRPAERPAAGRWPLAAPACAFPRPVLTLGEASEAQRHMSARVARTTLLACWAKTRSAIGLSPHSDWSSACTQLETQRGARLRRSEGLRPAQLASQPRHAGRELRLPGSGSPGDCSGAGGRRAPRRLGGTAHSRRSQSDRVAEQVVPAAIAQKDREHVGGAIAPRLCMTAQARHDVSTCSTVGHKSCHMKAEPVQARIEV